MPLACSLPDPSPKTAPTNRPHHESSTAPKGISAAPCAIGLPSDVSLTFFWSSQRTCRPSVLGYDLGAARIYRHWQGASCAVQPRASRHHGHLSFYSLDKLVSDVSDGHWFGNGTRY